MSRLLKRYFPARFLCVLVLMLTSSMFVCRVALAAGAPIDAAGVHARAMDLGLGGKVKLVLADGSQVRGVISAIDSKTVDVRTKGSKGTVTVAYSDVVNVKNGKPWAVRVGEDIGLGVVDVVLFPVMLVMFLTGHGTC